MLRKPARRVHVRAHCHCPYFVVAYMCEFVKLLCLDNLHILENLEKNPHNQSMDFEQA
jgi:hypothetical protein